MLKRDFRLFRRGVIPALVLSLLLAACSGAALLSVLKNAEARELASMALVDRENSLMSRLAIRIVSGQESISSLMEITETDEEDALKGLHEGRYAAALILPKGYLDAILRGEPAEADLFLSDAAAANAEIVAAVADFGSQFLSAGQNGVFAGEELIRSHGLSGEFHESFLELSNSALLDTALDVQQGAFRLTLVSYAGTGVSLRAHFVLCWLVLLLLLCGLFFRELYTADVCRPMVSRLFCCGIRPGGFLAGKLLWPFLFRAALLAVFAVICVKSGLLPLYFTPKSLLYAAAGLLLLTIFTACPAVLLAGRGGWSYAISIIGILGLFLSGALVPRTMLPDAILTLGRFWPSGTAAAALSPLFGGKPDLPALCAGIFYGLLLLFYTLHRLALLPCSGAEEGGRA